MGYACFRSDNMSGTINGKDLVSVKYYTGVDADTPAEIENGNLVVVGGYLSGEREVRKATQPAANSALESLAVIGSEEVVKSKKYNGLNEFRNEAGDICRGYRLRTGDIFSVTGEALNIDSLANVVANTSLVEAYAGTKFNVVTSITPLSTKIGTIIDVETVGDKTWYTIEVA